MLKVREKGYLATRANVPTGQTERDASELPVINKHRCCVIFCNDHVMNVKRIFSAACCNAASATTSIAPKSASLHACRRTCFIGIMCAARPICPDKCGARILCFFFQLAALLCLPKVIVN